MSVRDNDLASGAANPTLPILFSSNSPHVRCFDHPVNHETLSRRGSLLAVPAAQTGSRKMKEGQEWSELSHEHAYSCEVRVCGCDSVILLDIPGLADSNQHS